MYTGVVYKVGPFDVLVRWSVGPACAGCVVVTVLAFPSLPGLRLPARQRTSGNVSPRWDPGLPTTSAGAVLPCRGM